MNRQVDSEYGSRTQGEKKIIYTLAAVLFILALRYFALCIHESEAEAPVSSSASGVTDGTSYSKLYPELKASAEEIPTSLVQDKKIAYLTFDDGPSSNTDIVLDILKAEKVKATFFVIGLDLDETDYDRMKRIVEEGHTIGIHTFSHDYNKIYQSVESYLGDFAKMYNLIVETTGYKPNIFRFPGGSNNKYLSKIRDEIVTEMRGRGFTFYDWSVSAEDAVGTPTKASVKKHLKESYDYSYPVVLMHDASYNNVMPSILKEFITELKDAGYEFDTVDKRVPLQFRAR